MENSFSSVFSGKWKDTRKCQFLIPQIQVEYSTLVVVFAVREFLINTQN